MTLVLAAIASAMASFEIGFCNGFGEGYHMRQPDDQVERWELPFDNGTHLIVRWHAAKWACGRNITEYKVDVKTSSALVTAAINFFGRMPQDVCAHGSVARSKLAVDGVATGNGPTPCTPYDCRVSTHESAVAIPSGLRWLAGWDITVAVVATGKMAPVRRYGEPARDEKPVVFWAHKYRKVPSVAQQGRAVGIEEL